MVALKNFSLGGDWIDKIDFAGRDQPFFWDEHARTLLDKILFE